MQVPQEHKHNKPSKTPPSSRAKKQRQDKALRYVSYDDDYKKIPGSEPAEEFFDFVPIVHLFIPKCLNDLRNA